MSESTEIPSASFTDRHGRTWTLLLTFGVVDRIKEHTNGDIDFHDIMEDSTKLAKLLMDKNGRRMCECLYVICEKQIQDAGLTPEEWADSFDGRTIDRAMTGVIGALADFFPRSKVGGAIKTDLPAWMEQLDNKTIADMRNRNRVGLGALVKK
jgi:hypothetical protein